MCGATSCACAAGVRLQCIPGRMWWIVWKPLLNVHQLIRRPTKLRAWLYAEPGAQPSCCKRFIVMIPHAANWCGITIHTRALRQSRAISAAHHATNTADSSRNCRAQRGRRRSVARTYRNSAVRIEALIDGMKSRRFSRFHRCRALVVRMRSLRLSVYLW